MGERCLNEEIFFFFWRNDLKMLLIYDFFFIFVPEVMAFDEHKLNVWFT